MRNITTALLLDRRLDRVVGADKQSGPPQVTFEDIAAGLKDPSKWLTYSGTYDGQRHSPLTQITPANVHQLTAQWTFQTGAAWLLSGDPDCDRRCVVRHRRQQ